MTVMCHVGQYYQIVLVCLSTLSPWHSIVKDSIFRDAIFKDSISRDAIFKDSISRDAIFKDSISRDAIFKDSILILIRFLLSDSTDMCRKHEMVFRESHHGSFSRVMKIESQGESDEERTRAGKKKAGEIVSIGGEKEGERKKEEREKERNR